MTLPLPDLLRRACDDAFLTLTIADARANDALDALTASTAAREATIEPDFEAFLRTLLPTIVARSSAFGVPMAAAVDDGMTLLRPPHGLRALLPGGADAIRARIRDECALAVRSLRSVCAGDGAIADEESEAIARLVVATGLDARDVATLFAEAPIPVAAIAIPEEVPRDLSRAIVEGAIEAAASDHLRTEERAAAAALAARFGLGTTSEIDAWISQVESRSVQRATERGHEAHALAAVVAYLIADLDEARCRALVHAIVTSLLPPHARAATIAELATSTPLSRAFHVATDRHESLLGAAWAAALGIDPRWTTRATLAERHRHAAIELGGERVARAARERVEGHLERVIAGEIAP